MAHYEVCQKVWYGNLLYIAGNVQTKYENKRIKLNLFKVRRKWNLTMWQRSAEYNRFQTFAACASCPSLIRENKKFSNNQILLCESIILHVFRQYDSIESTMPAVSDKGACPASLAHLDSFVCLPGSLTYNYIWCALTKLMNT